MTSFSRVQSADVFLRGKRTSRLLRVLKNPFHTEEINKQDIPNPFVLNYRKEHVSEENNDSTRQGGFLKVTVLGGFSSDFMETWGGREDLVTSREHLLLSVFCAYFLGRLSLPHPSCGPPSFPCHWALLVCSM